MNQKKCKDCAHCNDNCKYKAFLAKLADVHIDCKDCPIEKCIKTLECCAEVDECEECPLCESCNRKVFKDTLDLINRKQAEIERLEIELKAMRGAANTYKKSYNKAKSEAIKEFAEKMKKRFYLSAGRCVVDVYHIDNLVKEMTEVSEK